MRFSTRYRVCSANTVARSAGLSGAPAAALPPAPPSPPAAPEPPAPPSVRSSAASKAACSAAQLALPGGRLLAVGRPSPVQGHLDSWHEPAGVPPPHRGAPQGRRPRLLERCLLPPRLCLMAASVGASCTGLQTSSTVSAACMTACSPHRYR
eukprot:365636-Chlamydomonas_euryale.AAC.7